MHDETKQYAVGMEISQLAEELVYYVLINILTNYRINGAYAYTVVVIR